MYCSKNLVSNARNVPDEFIFSYYCNMKVKFDGSSFKIKSIFNPKEKTESMCVYFKNGRYRFKDFSSGKGGSAIELVKQYFKLDFIGALDKILEDYNNWIISNNYDCDLTLKELKSEKRYKVQNYTIRSWNSFDKKYWQDYKLSSVILENAGIFPMAEYTLSKDFENGEVNRLRIQGEFIYGYFTEYHELYKIYQPKIGANKFLNVKDHQEGMESIGNNDYLIIASSKKDIECLKLLGLRCDFIAPNSENSRFKASFIKDLKKTYKGIVTIYDSDKPGVEAAKNLFDTHQIPFVYFHHSKDPAESIKERGIEETKYLIIPMIHKQLERYECINKA